MSRHDTHRDAADTHSGDRDSRPIKVRILDKQVQLGCRAGEEEALLQAAAYVNASMRDMRTRNPSSSLEKIAIVTAINTANDLLRARQRNQAADPVPTAQPMDTDASSGSDPAVEPPAGPPASIETRLKTLNDEVEALLASRR